MPTRTLGTYRPLDFALEALSRRAEVARRALVV